MFKKNQIFIIKQKNTKWQIKFFRQSEFCFVQNFFFLTVMQNNNIREIKTNEQTSYFICKKCNKLITTKKINMIHNCRQKLAVKIKAISIKTLISYLFPKRLKRCQMKYANACAVYSTPDSSKMDQTHNSDKPKIRSVLSNDLPMSIPFM